MRGTSVAMHLWMLDGMESEVLLDMLDRDEKKKQIIINSFVWWSESEIDCDR